MKDLKDTIVGVKFENKDGKQEMIKLTREDLLDIMTEILMNHTPVNNNDHQTKQ